VWKEEASVFCWVSSFYHMIKDGSHMQRRVFVPLLLAPGIALQNFNFKNGLVFNM